MADNPAELGCPSQIRATVSLQMQSGVWHAKSSACLQNGTETCQEKSVQLEKKLQGQAPRLTSCFCRFPYGVIFLDLEELGEAVPRL